MEDQSSSSAAPLRFAVLVRDNFHYMDEDDVAEAAQFDDYAAAVSHCKVIVDASLAHQHKPAMTAEELYEAYTSFGDDPSISPSPPDAPFSAWTYAKQRCAELCDPADGR